MIATERLLLPKKGGKAVDEGALAGPGRPGDANPPRLARVREQRPEQRLGIRSAILDFS